MAAAEGLWPVVFATFVAYALLPLPTWFATLFGFLTACAHLLVVSFLPTALPSLAWPQIIGKTCSFSGFLLSLVRFGLGDLRGRPPAIARGLLLRLVYVYNLILLFLVLYYYYYYYYYLNFKLNINPTLLFLVLYCLLYVIIMIIILILSFILILYYYF